MSEIYYMCVDKNFPEMKPFARYNCPTLPAIGGTQVYKLEEIFSSMGPLDTGYIKIESLPDTKTTINEEGQIFIDCYRFICRVKFTNDEIKRLLSMGANTMDKKYDSSLLMWCIETHNINILLHIIDNKYPVVEYMKKSIVQFVSFDGFNKVIQRLIEDGHDVHSDNDMLMLFATSTKNIALCRILLDLGANIPKQVYNMYSANPGIYPDMDFILKNYSDRILG